MPKIKTRRGAAKRFKVSGRGKIMRGKAFHNHNLTKKARHRKRRLRQDGQVDAVDHNRMREQIPYL